MMAVVAPAIHTPVLLREVVEFLGVQPGGRYIDCTVGGGGHAEAILEASMPRGQLLGLDADSDAIKVATERLQNYGSAALLVNENFANLAVVCREHSFYPVQGILFDLGVSSMQLADGPRGFSFQIDAPLDMRFGRNQQLTATDIVDTFSEEEITAVLRKYGEERKSRSIARHIAASRPIGSTLHLSKIVEEVVTDRKSRKIHPATKTFQALRIAVNRELECLRDALKQAIGLLAPGGRMVVIGYHSLENRVVKEFLRQETRGCLCSPITPVCVCEHAPTLKLITKKVVKPSLAEVNGNPRSRSAKLRVAERLGGVDH